MAGKRQRETTAAVLTEDLILEIIKRLPLKYAVQCSGLNKNIRRSISHQPNLLSHYSTIFHCSNHEPRIYKVIEGNIRSKTVDPICKSLTLATILVIKQSCNGLLFLRLNKYNPVYLIFNPTTASVIEVDFTIDFYDIALAAPDNSRCKLVAVYNCGDHLDFRVLEPTGDPISRTFHYYSGSFKLMTDDNSRPVYAHGSLYWLGDDGRVTVAFDVENLKARLFDGPAKRGEKSKWFGFADGAVHFVYSSSAASEIVICRLDHFQGEWRMTHRIPIPDHDSPLLFDGRRVLYLLRKSGEGGDIYRYDLVADSWGKIESLDSWRDCKPNFFSFTSSFAKVHDLYFNKKNAPFWNSEGVKKIFLGVQKLLTPAETPIHVPQDLSGPEKARRNRAEKELGSFWRCGRRDEDSIWRWGRTDSDI